MAIATAFGFTGKEFRLVVDSDDYPSPGIAVRHLETGIVAYSNRHKDDEVKNYTLALRQLRRKLDRL